MTIKTLINRDRLKDKYGDEKVFIVPYSLTTKINDLFNPGFENKRLAETFEHHGNFIFRYDAEYNESFQQIIPYIIIVNKNADKIYVSERIAGEERLRHKLSFFGGHINPCDHTGLTNIVINAAKRELNEEVNVTNLGDFYPVGTVRDKASTTPDHLGFVYSVEVDDASIKETDNLKGKWMTYNDVITEYSNFEGWARYIIDFIFSSGQKNFSCIKKTVNI